MPISRRGFITASGLLLGQASLAGCLAPDDTATESSELTLFSWCSGDGAKAGLSALIADFKQQHPGIQVTDEAIPGGAGSKAQAALAARIRAGHPPDTFQVHAGAELSDYIKAGQLEDLSPLYEEEAWQVAFSHSLLEFIGQGEKIYSVPVNIHRANVLWHSVKVLDEAGVSESPKSFEEFFVSLDRVKAAGRTALAIGEPWTAQHLMETVLLGGLGAAGYSQLWEASGDWGGAKVTDALQTFAELLTYTDRGTERRTWQEACASLGNGQAGFYVMGDWADSYFTVDLGLTPQEDYGWSAAPATEGVYQFLSDSFTLPTGAEHRDAAIAWLRECGSKSGQEAFNPKKGSIPARFDADPKLFGPYLRWALNQWRESRDVVGSLTHGVVANLAWTAEIGAALAVFLRDRRVNRFQDALGAAAGKHAD